jgi:hypothetical protein
MQSLRSAYDRGNLATLVGHRMGGQNYLELLRVPEGMLSYRLLLSDCISMLSNNFVTVKNSMVIIAHYGLRDTVACLFLWRLPECCSSNSLLAAARQANGLVQ